MDECNSGVLESLYAPLEYEVMKRISIIVCTIVCLIGCSKPSQNKISLFSAHIATVAEQEGISFAEAAAKVRDLGYEAVDVFYFIDPANLRSLDSLGFKHACAVTFFDLSSEDRDAKEQLSLDFARENHFDKLMFVPGNVAGAPADVIYERIRDFVKRAANQGTRIVFEDCDNDAFCNDFQSLRQLFANVPDIGHAFDTGNYLYFGDDCLEAFHEFRDKIEHVHLKDRFSRENQASVPCFTGCIPQEKIVRELMRSGYDGYYTVEIYGSDHMLSDLEISIRNLRTVLSGKPAPKANKKDIGLQLYSVKGIEGDFEGTLERLAGLGVTSVEISGYTPGKPVYGYSPSQLKDIVEAHGLKLKSSNAVGPGFDIDNEEACLELWRQTFADHKAMGCKYFAQTGGILWGDEQMASRTCALMNKVGALAREYGLRFLFHNHNQEFYPLKGSDIIPYDYIMSHTDPDLVSFEMDTYWVMQGKQDPVAYLNKYPGRFNVLHVKDYYILGRSGRLDFEAIFDAFYKQGGEDFFIEMEDDVPVEQADYTASVMFSLADHYEEVLAMIRNNPAPQVAQTEENVKEIREKSLQDICASFNYLHSAPYIRTQEEQ